MKKVTKSDLHWSLQHTSSLQRWKSSSLAFQGSTTSIFVGKHNYPNISAGVLAAKEYDHNDDVSHFKKNKLSIPQIIDKRLSLLHASQKHNIYQPKDLLKVVALAENTLGTDVTINNNISVQPHFRKEAMPFGPRVQAQVVLSDEPKIKRYVDSVASDTDVKAATAIQELNTKKDEHFITQALSSGSLGQQKKLVPTRWAITAVDDTLGKQHIENIKTYDISPNLALFGSYLGNYCMVLLFEQPWAFELFEMHESSTGFSTDHEISPRKEYAQNCAGGYYASRFACTQHLLNNKQQSTVVILRLITNEYSAPLGVWVLREAVRNALAAEPIQFANKELLMTYAKSFFKKKFQYSVEEQLAQSKVLHTPRQTSLGTFLHSK